jgi:solute carrier family 25 (mitochondrial folate transporter), member 32
VQSNTTYTVISGASKFGALCATYPYQVIRSRIQVTTNSYTLPPIVLRTDAADRLYVRQNDSVLARTHHRTIPSTIAHTWAHEGAVGFYRGLGTNLVRVLPGTCVTFVVYENLAWLLKRAASRREAARAGAETGGARR